MWDLKQRNFFCGHLKLRSSSIRADRRFTIGCGCRDSLYTGLGAALLSLPMSLSSGSRHRGGERVTYLDLLNSFHQWQKSNYLPGNARLLYYGLLAIFNEARWPEQVQIDNFRLMSMLDTRTERVAIAARDSLVAAGLIEYSRGKKRSPNTYRLKYTPQKVSENGSESGSVFDSETVSTSSSVSVSKTVSHIEDKEKDLLLFRLPPERRDRSRFLSTTRFHTALRAGLRIRSKIVYRTARRIQKRPCRIGRRTSTSAIDWMGTAGRTSIRFYSFHSLICSGKATSCQGANSENNTRSSWQKWGVAARDAGHFFS